MRVILICLVVLLVGCCIKVTTIDIITVAVDEIGLEVTSGKQDVQKP
jgi:hypothetical protein